MKQALTVLCVVLASCLCAYAQGDGASLPASFADSVKTTLERTRSLDASAVGSAFSTLWSQLPVDQQLLIKSQSYAMRKRKFPAKSHLTSYYGAIVNALTIEKADRATLASYLNVAAKVIETATPAQALKFFASSRTFFKHHALSYDNTFRLYPRDDRYIFEYIEMIPVETLSWDDPIPAETDTASYGQDTQGAGTFSESSSSFAEAPVDNAFLPSWVAPPPPPELSGPVIRFDKASLNFVTSHDSVFLRDTRGTFSILQDLFVGEGGVFEWTPAGLDPDSVICNMTTYDFSVRKPQLTAAVVKLNYVGKTPGFVAGTFEYRSESRRDSTLSTYPRFKSYESNLKVTGLADENVRYTGGFSLIGNQITSASVAGDPAVIEVYHDGQKKFTAASAGFDFSPGTISSANTRINIHQGNDSIVHQAVRMKYTYGPDSTQHLLLQKDKGEMRNAPYNATFFNVYFSADAIRWDLNSDSLNLQIEGARNTVPVIIESTDFYDPEDYRLLKGVGFNFHPLALVANYAVKNQVREFYSGDLAHYSGVDPLAIKHGIDFLRQKGLVNYDGRTDVVQVKQKAIDLFLAHEGEEDYDNLKIHSVIATHPNATINFEDRYMRVRGVEEFDISDSLNVHIVPDSSVVTILQNRDIKFDGTVSAGNFEITGKGFTLKYDSFFISLSHIDSINFFVTEKNARGQSIRRKVNNSMVGADSAAAAAGGLGNTASSSGTLFISKANNKSGKLDVPGYPRLDATTGGVIYFDREEVLGGVYDRSMFFVVPPFRLDSLNNADPLSIKFDGTFVSSGMLPSIKETLHTMPDKSLGFEHAIPPPGYQLYKGDGRMNGVITMSNRGLRGMGEIDFLAARISSRDFTFYPDSVVARGNRATIEEKQFGSVVFPQASLPDFELKWLPKEDQMRLRNLKAPFNFYDSTAQMRGVLTISKEGVAGAGKLETRGTELISRYMNFGGKEFSARHARFKVKSDDPAKNLLAGDDIRLKFNLEQNYADISPEIEGTAAIDFPYAQFKTSIPRARWDLAAQTITMSKAPDVPIESSYFYTTREELDSLHFNAEKAEYNLKTQELKVSGIPYIIVADALITPENNEVLIHENARIGTLRNTTIVLDTLNGYHRLTEGVVDIVSRKEFSGHATYQYVNLLNDTFAIKMTDFHLEPISDEEGSRRQDRDPSAATMQTVARGSVRAEENLVLGAGMFYKGDMTMYATRPALQLDGFLKLDINSLKNYNTWIQYQQSGDETEIVLDFDKAVDEEGRRVTAGLHFSSADNSLYLTFANAKRSEDDDDLFTPSGMLYYDTESGEYKIEDLEKTAGTKLSGKVFAYNDSTMQVRFEGHVDLYNGGKNFNITSTAIGTGNFESGDVTLNSFIMVDTDVPSTAFDVMARDVQDVIKNEGAEEGLGDQTELLYKIANIIGERAVKEYEAQSLQGYVSLSTIPELAKPLVFSNVKLKWSPEHKAFYSEGKLGISHMGRNDINGAFDGFMEIRRSPDGVPVFHVFFKASANSWYYFGIEDNRLLIHSANEDFNDVISKKTNAGKVKIGEVAFIPGSEEETLLFINRFRKQYMDIDIPYSLYEPPTPLETAPPPFMNATPPVNNAPVNNPPANDGFGPPPSVEPGVERETPDGSQKTEPRQTSGEPDQRQEQPGVDPGRQDGTKPTTEPGVEPEQPRQTEEPTDGREQEDAAQPPAPQKKEVEYDGF